MVHIIYIYTNILTLAYTLRYVSSSFTEKATDCCKCMLMLAWSSQLLSSWAHLFMNRSVPRETYEYHRWPSNCTVTTLPASWKRSRSFIVWFLIHWRLWFVSLKVALYLEMVLVQGCWSSKLILPAAWWSDHRRPSWATTWEVAPILRRCRRKVTLPWHPQIYPPKTKKNSTWNQYWIWKQTNKHQSED